MLSNKEIEEIREELIHCQRPLFFFHDDPDGLSSFLLLYRFKREGAGVIVKTYPELNTMFLKKVVEYAPDKIFILDKALVSQDFLDNVKVPVVWIDHHEPVKADKVRYFNPRIKNPADNAPVSYICYKVAEQDSWIAMVGIVGDWQMPVFSAEFSEKYPDLLPNDIKEPERVLFSTHLGTLIRIFSFILKGRNNEAMKSVKILTRITDPYEILNKSTSQGKFIYEKYEKVNIIYQALLKEALEKSAKQDFIEFIYKNSEFSFTSDLSNELLYHHPKKFIVVGREKSGEIKLSLRYSACKIPPMLETALAGLHGYGGGHEYAVGVNIKQEDYPEFLQRIKKLVEEKS
jgi:single-stranded DNA-specific DHH superfamily exonuclease